MPVRTRKLGVNDKDESALNFPEDDFRRHWVSAEPGPRNSNPKVASNQQNNGFEHLKLAPTSSVRTVLNDKPDFTNFGPEKVTKYLGMLRDKLSLTKDYILQEKELSLDPDRIGMYHEATPVVLAVPPIRIDVCSQQMIRLLIGSAVELRRLNADTPEDQLDAALGQPMRDYLELWSMLQENLSRQLHGVNDTDKMNEADKIMDEVFEKLVEP
ncbi:hypothetical protein G6011_04778 [Alternaria panax]|uniref:Uncharacterized protein n=1 Tax=Alternaria panax TaxID=48097 RepID=A0AAD4IHU9_9PLEO|nr:hypothetical protein G6011_04778 [Alternaria panax]